MNGISPRTSNQVGVEPVKEPFVPDTRQKLMNVNERLAAVLDKQDAFKHRLLGTQGVEAAKDNKPTNLGIRGVADEFDLLFQRIVELEDFANNLSAIA